MKLYRIQIPRPKIPYAQLDPRELRTQFQGPSWVVLAEAQIMLTMAIIIAVRDFFNEPGQERTCYARHYSSTAPGEKAGIECSVSNDFVDQKPRMGGPTVGFYGENPKPVMVSLPIRVDVPITSARFLASVKSFARPGDLAGEIERTYCGLIAPELTEHFKTFLPVLWRSFSAQYGLDLPRELEEMFHPHSIAAKVLANKILQFEWPDLSIRDEAKIAGLLAQLPGIKL